MLRGWDLAHLKLSGYRSLGSACLTNRNLAVYSVLQLMTREVEDRGTSFPHYPAEKTWYPQIPPSTSKLLFRAT